MNIQIRSFLTIYFLLFSMGASFGQRVFIDENISYWYNLTNEVHIEHNVYFGEDTAHVYMEITFNEGKIYDDYSYMYELHESYHKLNIRASDTLDIRNHIISIKANKIFVYLKLPNNDKVDLAVFRITNKKSGMDYVYDIPFIKDYNFSTDGLVLYDQDGETPNLSSFMNSGQTVQVKSINPFSNRIFVFYYARNFEEAAPPMVIENQPQGKELKIDSVFTVQPNTAFSLTKEGMYFFQKDSSSADGIEIRVQDKYFPLVKTFDKVLDPLIYISTRSETEAIRNAPNPKAAFESYWLNIVKIPNLATSTIREYYQRVEAANYLFTNYKEGWKNDMGIIYIIYGPPNDVYKSEEIIDWVYNRDLNLPVVRFSFYKVKNVFTDDHYTLLRKKDYDKNWFKAVETWRKGKK